MPKIFIPNKSHHDFSPAHQYGDFVFLTDGWVSPLQVNSIYRLCYDKMKDCTVDDYLLISSLPMINVAAASIMAMKNNGMLNFLIFDHGNYLPMRISVEPGGIS